MANAFDNNKNLQKSLIARWGNQKWSITTKQIKTLESAAFEAEFDPDKKKKKQKAEVTIEYKLYQELVPDSDISLEIWKWRKLLKKSKPLYIGSVAIAGYRKYKLINVAASNIVTRHGQIVSCDMELTFRAELKNHSMKKYKRKKKQLNKKGLTKKLKQV